MSESGPIAFSAKMSCFFLTQLDCCSLQFPLPRPSIKPTMPAAFHPRPRLGLSARFARREVGASAAGFDR